MPQLAPERVLEIRRVTVLQITDIEVVVQQFRAHIYVELCIVGGAEDEKLAKEENTMTKEADGKWPVVPSALWYLENQLSIANAVECDVRECKIIKQGRDLILIKRICGLFSSPMDLHDFPVDGQDCSFNFECQCAVGGPFPVQIVTSKLTTSSIFEANFMPSNMWALDPRVEVIVEPSVLELGAGSKTYPAFKTRVRVLRKPAYYLFNIALPMEVLALLSILIPPCLPQSAPADRLSVTLGLMITAAAYKFAIATMLPPVAYLTLIDKFVMALSLVLLLCAVQNAVFGIKEGRGDGDSPLIFSQEADLASSAVLLGVWVLLHLLYWRKIVLAMRRRRSRFSGAAAALRMTGAGESESAASRA